MLLVRAVFATESETPGRGGYSCGSNFLLSLHYDPRRIHQKMETCRAHGARLNAAVAAAYGWPADISEEDALAKLLELNLARAGAAQHTESGEETDNED